MLNLTENKNSVHKFPTINIPQVQGKQSFFSTVISTALSWLIISTFILLLTGCPWPFHDEDKKEEVIEVTQTVAPTASFSASITSGKAPVLVVFTDNSTQGSASINSWSWDFGDGNTSTEQNPEYTYETAGTFDVGLTVTSNDGDDTSTQSALISVEPTDITTTITLIDEQGLPIEGAVVSSSIFSVENQLYNDLKQLVVKVIPNENSGVLRIEKIGYMTGIFYLASVEGDSTHQVILQKRAEKITFDAFYGGELIGIDGASVNIPAEALVRPDGSTALGDVDVYITPINIKDPNQAKAFPGAFRGKPLDPEQAEQEIISYGVVDITFMEGEVELQLKEGLFADIDVPIYAAIHPYGDAIKIGDSIPLWILDESTGIWQQESVGTVVANPLSPEGFSMRAQTSHFSIFNSDFFNGSGGDFDDCDMTVVLEGATFGKEITISYTMNIPKWGLLARTRTFIYQGEQFNFPLIKGLQMTFNAVQGDNSAVEILHCSNDENSKTVTMTLSENPPEFIDWLTEVQPVFSKNQTSDLYEITENKVLIGASFSGVSSGDITTDLVNHPLSLPPGQKFEALFSSEDNDPTSINITLTNDFGSVEESTLVNYINSQSPTLKHFYSNPRSVSSSVSYFWDVEGADEAVVYYLGDDLSALGTLVFRMNNAEVEMGTKEDWLLSDVSGYIRVEFSNQYGNTVFIGKLGQVLCPPNTDACYGGQ